MMILIFPHSLKRKSTKLIDTIIAEPQWHFQVVAIAYTPRSDIMSEPPLFIRGDFLRVLRCWALAHRNDSVILGIIENKL
jgi:hypothetical protein